MRRVQRRLFSPQMCIMPTNVLSQGGALSGKPFLLCFIKGFTNGVSGGFHAEFPQAHEVRDKFYEGFIGIWEILHRN